MAINPNEYILSSNIHVFPCSYRKQSSDDTGTTELFDPEARLNTEKNFANIGANLHRSYIIEYNATTSVLRFVVGGYYFEITGSAEIQKLYNKKVVISLKTNAQIGSYNTSILDSFSSDSGATLDKKDNNIYYFTGLKIIALDDTSTTYTTALQIFADATGTLKYENFLPEIYAGSSSAKSAIKIGTPYNGTWVFSSPNAGSTYHGVSFSTEASGENATTIGGKSVARGKRSLSTGSATIAVGDYSHSEGNSTLASKENAHAEGLQTVARGSNSHAEGNNTQADGDNAHAEGKNTISSGDSSFAGGANTKSSNFASFAIGDHSEARAPKSFAGGQSSVVDAAADNAFAFGNNAINYAADSFVVGKFNNSTSDTAFAVGNGTDANTRQNAFEVKKDGDVIAQGTIEANYFKNSDNSFYADDTGELFCDTVETVGTITAGSAIEGNNGLTISGSVSNLNSGIAVNTNKFTVSNAGAVTANSTLTVTGLSSLNGGIAVDTNKFTVSTAGAVVAAGTVTATGFITVSDRRLKENIVEYKAEKSILDLPVYKYDYINGRKNQIGCMAQDLKEICPEAVEENANGYLAVNESKIVYLLLEEVKKLKKEIEALK